MGFRADLPVAEYIERTGWAHELGEYEQFTEQAPKQRPSSRLRGPEELVEASPCTALDTFPTVIWDANGYYRAHGFTWPYRGITVKALRLAHHERGGTSDPFMTYALKQLRNAQTRRDYDSTPLGRPFLDDYLRKIIAERLNAKAEAMRERTGETFDVDAALRAMGFGVAPEEAEGSTEDVSAGQAASSTPPAEASEGPDSVLPPWSWSYYQLNSTCDDTERLRRWQEMLVQAFTEAGSRFRFAVGFVGRTPQQYMTAEIEGRLIFLLNERAVPDPQLATLAVASQTYLGAA